MGPRVPMVDLAARHARLRQAVEAAVAEVLASGRYIGGIPLEYLESRLAARHGRAFCVGAGSGTGALRLLLQASGIGPGDAVVVPALTFGATAEAVLQVGARPVVVDVLPDAPLMDPAAAAAAVEAGAQAVLLVHLFGLQAPDPQLPTGCDALLLDDAAQAIGRALPGGPSRAAALSFYPTKVLGAAGDGGAVLTDDAGLARRVRLLGSHGSEAPHQHEAIAGHIGDNNRLDALQAAVLGVHLGDLDRRLARRRAIAARYDRDLGLPAVAHDPESPVSVYCLLSPDRAGLAARLERAGIATARYYPRPLGQQPLLAGRATLHPSPNADVFCENALAIPCHEEMTEADVDAVIAACRGET